MLRCGRAPAEIVTEQLNCNTSPSVDAVQNYYIKIKIPETIGNTYFILIAGLVKPLLIVEYGYVVELRMN